MERTNSALDGKIDEWRDYWLSSGAISTAEMAELEDHLREEIAALTAKGLTDEEAFLVAVRRMGDLPSVSREFREINTRDLWKQLFPEPVDSEDRRARMRELTLAIVLAVFAGLLIELPRLFGIDFEGHDIFYAKNISFFVLPFITLYFARKRQAPPMVMAAIAVAFPVALVLINLYPFSENSHTLFLSVMHLPLCLWFFTGIAYTSPEWQDTIRRMDFLRFSGEIFIYETLLMCGVFVVTGLTIMLFESIDIAAENAVVNNFSIPVAAASLVIAAYLVDQKKNVVENFAPILARIFAPLLLGVMLVFLGAMVVLGKSPFVERDFLIGFDLMLILVLGIVFYIISTRKETSGPQVYDWINLALIVTALVIDVIALSAIVFRLGAFGISPNKMAALGENILVFVNLSGIALLYLMFMAGKVSFARVEWWQTKLLPLYALWLGFVGLVFPLIFSFA